MGCALAKAGHKTLRHHAGTLNYAPSPSQGEGGLYESHVV